MTSSARLDLIKLLQTAAFITRLASKSKSLSPDPMSVSPDCLYRLTGYRIAIELAKLLIFLIHFRLKSHSSLYSAVPVFRKVLLSVFKFDAQIVSSTMLLHFGPNSTSASCTCETALNLGDW